SPICLRLLTHCERRAASRAAWTAGNSRAIKTAMIAITTSSSISVKPRRRMSHLPNDWKIFRDRDGYADDDRRPAQAERRDVFRSDACRRGGRVLFSTQATTNASTASILLI